MKRNKKKIKPESNNQKIKYIVCWSNYSLLFLFNEMIE